MSSLKSCVASIYRHHSLQPVVEQAPILCLPFKPKHDAWLSIKTVEHMDLDAVLFVMLGFRVYRVFAKPLAVREACIC